MKGSMSGRFPSPPPAAAATVQNQTGGEATTCQPPPSNSSTPAIEVDDLWFRYGGQEFGGDDAARSSVLSGVSASLPRGSLCLLVGANGAGKSTLLRLLAGKTMAKPDGCVRVLGRNAFRDTALNLLRSHMDHDWGVRTVAFAGYGCPMQMDMPVKDMMASLQAEFPERRERLMRLLCIDPNWRMHRVSDGQRRRIQLFLRLLRPFEVLLMDEVTTCLDIVCRQDLLHFLSEEARTRQATVVYATHIFDGLDDWPSHILYLTSQGRIGFSGSPNDLEGYSALRQQGNASPLLRVFEAMLRKERDDDQARNRMREQEAGEGAKAHTSSLNRHGSGFSNGRMYNYWG